MKIGIHQHVFTGKIDKSNLDIINFISEIGFDSMGINLSLEVKCPNNIS